MPDLRCLSGTGSIHNPALGLLPNSSIPLLIEWYVTARKVLSSVLAVIDYAVTMPKSLLIVRRSKLLKPLAQSLAVCELECTLRTRGFYVVSIMLVQQSERIP